MTPQCFLDMDGVLVDFVGGVLKVHKRPSPYDDPANIGIFDMETLWGMTRSEFWVPCNTIEFWAGLAKTPECDEIVAAALALFGMENVAILTSPAQHPASLCIPGKREWVKRYYPFLLDHMIFCKSEAKQFIAGPNKVLVDDKDTNVEEFIEAGGCGILVPRPWNAGQPLSVGGELLAFMETQDG